MRVENALKALDVIVERNRKNSFSSKGEGEMRLKVRDLRDVLNALNDGASTAVKCDEDINTYGASISKDGERVDPKDFYKPNEQLDSKDSEDFGVKLFNKYGNCIIKSTTCDSIILDLISWGLTKQPAQKREISVEELAEILSKMESECYKRAGYVKETDRLSVGYAKLIKREIERTGEV
jgi:hypothetical protein